jgi:hypothetical protein
MLQVVYLDIVKIHQDVSIRIQNVSSVADVCCKCFTSILHMFHVYVASASFKCFSCFRRILHLFHLECFMFHWYVQRGAWIRVCLCVRAKRSTRGQSRMRAGSTGGGPHVAFFLGSVVCSWHTHASWGWERTME